MKVQRPTGMTHRSGKGRMPGLIILKATQTLMPDGWYVTSPGARAMSRNILVVNGHPDPRPERFCAALCDAYEAGARAKGCATRRLDVGSLHLSLLTAGDDAEPWDGIEQAYRLMRAADRLAIVYPLWLDGPPAELSQLFDIVAKLQSHLTPDPVLAAKSARIVVTTALPSFLYRGKDTVVRLNGIAGDPTFIGAVDTISAGQRTRWLEQVRSFGEAMN